MVALLIKFLWDKALYGRVTRPLLDFSERGLGTRLLSIRVRKIVWARDYVRVSKLLQLSEFQNKSFRAHASHPSLTSRERVDTAR